MSFFNVKYGKDLTHMFNADCKVLILLDKIKETCGFNELDTIDIANPKYGSVRKDAYWHRWLACWFIDPCRLAFNTERGNV